jgi:hypothetical protein
MELELKIKKMTTTFEIFVLEGKKNEEIKREK